MNIYLLSLSFISSRKWAFFVPMEYDGEMSGTDAIQRMRNLKLIPGASFGIKFITCDLNRVRGGEIRIYARCQIRAARRSEGLQVNSDHYLYFIDIEEEQPKQCFKILIRAICLPPNNKWYKVKW